jgi:valyl-tRNA synthetase
MNLPKKYNFSESENKWKKYWEKNKIYKFDPKSNKKIYSVDTPPPTVSGEMHIGHALSYSQEDFVVRFQRMNGKNVFYPFGTDDNGLPTERLVERLKKVKSVDMKKNEFVKLCQKTVKEILPKFVQDWKDVGMSCDFDTTYSTIDDHSIKTSQKSFIDLYKKKLVSRKSSPTMWCVNCQTAIAQAELEDKSFSSTFNDIKFEVEGKELIISTTRPELIPACVCIYVHPDDKRYKKIVGKKVKIPLFGYTVPIFADKSAEPEKGSGAMMVCSYGDRYDVEAITKRKLDPRIVFAKDGKLNELAGKYEGLTIKEARNKILEDLEKKKLLVDKREIEHVVNVHDKCGTEVEFLSSEQWFIDILKNKSKLIKAANDINWYPKFMKARYVNWVKNLEWDWNISRQRHYGVPFPVWYCKKCGEAIVADEKQLPVYPSNSKPLVKCKCGSNSFVAEEDVLDTWATSSCTPQIVLDWVKDKKGTYEDVDFGKMYPMSMRPQAHDIIRTWAFYTIVKGIYHEKKIPWKDIVISGFVLDPSRMKMSKSKGNAIHPQDVLDKYGADALRYWASGSGLGNDFAYREDDILTGVKTITKLWNASKFALMHLEDFDGKKVKLTEVDKGIISKFNSIVKESTLAFENYEYAKSKLMVDVFFWNIFCDNYLEIVKDRLYNPYKRGNDDRRSAQFTLHYLLNGILKMFAPIMPFITEEIYQLYFAKGEKMKSIHNSSWPKYDANLNDNGAEKVFDTFVNVLNNVRQLKAKANKSLKEEVGLTLTKDAYSMLFSSMDDLKAVCNARDVKKGSKFDVEW